jgi:hypothetical protein
MSNAAMNRGLGKATTLSLFSLFSESKSEVQLKVRRDLQRGPSELSMLL